MAYGFTYTLPTVTSQSNFPVLLKTVDFPSAAIDASANSFSTGGGSMMAYTSSAKTTQLPLEIVTLVSSATVPEAEVWVKVTSLATSGTIYIEADGSQTVQPAASSTFGRDNVWNDYVAVWHCNNTTDSTGNGHTLTEVASPSTVSGGVFGNAYDLNGSTQYLTAAHATALNVTNNYTLQAIVAHDIAATGAETYGRIIDKTNSNTVGYALITDHDVDSTWKAANNELNVAALETSALSYAAGEEIWLAGTFNSTTRRVVQNGVDIASDTPSGTVTGSTTDLHIGMRDTGTLPWNGTIDEVRLMATARSAAWLLVEYNNQSSATAWGTVGTYNAATPTAITDGTGITSVSGVGTANLPDVSGYVVDTLGAPFTSASHTIEFVLGDGTDEAVLAGTYSPKTGYAVQEITSGVKTPGSVLENFIGTIVDSSQVLYPTANNTVIDATGVLQTDSTTDLDLQFWDASDENWKQLTVIILEITATLSGDITASVNEADIVAGGKQLIITLTGDTWATGVDFDNARQAIIDGLNGV